MRILVTGAGGNLGRVVVPALADEEHTPVLFDFRSVETEHESIEGDVRDFETVAKATRGADAIIHAAALHGIHVGEWPEQEFWSINATGTFNVFEAARLRGVKRIVLASSMAVYGQSAVPTEESWAVVTEESPVLPTDVYGLSKAVCEELARYYSRSTGISTVALRFGMFVPETFERYGFRLLFGGVDDRDVAQAVLFAQTRAARWIRRFRHHGRDAFRRTRRPRYECGPGQRP